MINTETNAFIQYFCSLKRKDTDTEKVQKKLFCFVMQCFINKGCLTKKKK